MIINKLKIIKKMIKKIIINAFNINETIRESIVIDRLNQDTLKSTSSLISSEHEENVVVSLTTYDKRIGDVHLVIESIGNQTLKPKRIILWLDENEYSLDSLPLSILRQIDRGLEVKFCKNFRSYKKLIPTLQICPKDKIVTIDDDVIYPHYFIEYLVYESLRNPDVVCCYRAHRVTMKPTMKVDKYINWEQCTHTKTAGLDIFPTGIGGVLYPPNSLHHDCIDIENAMKLCPVGDDIWFKAMSLLNGTKAKVIERPFNFEYDFIELSKNQDMALSINNVGGGGNDKQLEALFSYYPSLRFSEY